MPTCEYRCEGWEKEFLVSMQSAEHDRGGIASPGCGGASVVQQYGAFSAGTSRKS